MAAIRRRSFRREPPPKDTLQRKSRAAGVVCGGPRVAGALKNAWVDSRFTRCAGPIIDDRCVDEGLRINGAQAGRPGGLCRAA